MKHTTLDIYDAELFLATSKDDWRKVRKTCTYLDKPVPTSAGQSAFAAFEPDLGGPAVPHIAFWVDLKQHPDTVSLIDTCSHEATHGAGQLLEHIGHQITGTDEPHAYLVGWLTRWLWAGCQS